MHTGRGIFTDRQASSQKRIRHIYPKGPTGGRGYNDGKQQQQQQLWQQPSQSPAGICLFASSAVCASYCRSVCSLAVCFVCLNRVYYMPLRVLPHGSASGGVGDGRRITLKLSPQKLQRFLFINFNCFNKKSRTTNNGNSNNQQQL